MMISKDKLLKKPRLPQRDDNTGVLDVSLTQNFMLVIVDRFDGESPNQDITILLNGITVKHSDHYVDNPLPPQIFIRIPFSKLVDGNYKVSYNVTTVGHDVFSSEAVEVKIINNRFAEYIVDFKWINPIFQVDAGTILKETLHLAFKANPYNPTNTNTSITFKLDNSNVIFKESNSQTWTTKTLQDESIDISIACLKNRDTQFVISAYLTDFPETKAPPLSAKFISTFVIQVITQPYIYDTGFQAEIGFSVKNPDGSGEIITLNPFCNKSYAPDDASQSKCYPYGPVNNDPSSGGIFENYQLITNSSGFTSTKFTGYYPDKICISASTSSPIKEINSQLIQYRNRYTISMTPSKQGDIKVGDIIDCTVKIWQTSSPHHWKLDDTNVTWSIVHDTTVSMYHPGVITFDPPSGSIELKNNETIGKHGSFSTKANILKLPENISALAIRIDVNTPQGYNSNQYVGFKKIKIDFIKIINKCPHS